MSIFDTVLIVLGVCVLAFVCALVVSKSLRAKTRVLLKKRLFSYKYDYRHEWLRFIATLSVSGEEQVHATAIRAVAQIVDSPGGALWVKREDGDSYEPIASWNCDMSQFEPVDEKSCLVHFLQEQQWIIDLNELVKDPERYERLEPGSFYSEPANWWLIVPMFLGARLYGFIMLLQPPVLTKLNFEDHDLLKTVGRQVATHVNQAEADRRLAEAKQFGAYNRLTAFLMHDLNNLIAQQSMVVANAEKYRSDPAFVDDAINTIAHSVDRMRRLMEQLTSKSKTPLIRRVDLMAIVETAVNRSRTRPPLPRIVMSEGSIWVKADPERLCTVIEHLIRNAQDATPDDGKVEVLVSRNASMGSIRIKDTGCGMTSEFIRDRLYRPFDSTKGSQRMGIGAHQAREYVTALGGRIDVKSKPGAGTMFAVTLPLTD